MLGGGWQKRDERPFIKTTTTATKTFTEHSFILVGPQDYFAYVLNFQSCAPTANDYPTPIPNPKPGLEWTLMHCLENWMSPTHKKEIAFSKCIARHYKLGSLQCKSSCPAISYKKEGACQSPRELLGNWGIRHQAKIDAQAPSVTGDQMRYLEQDVAGERKPFVAITAPLGSKS